MEVTKVTSTEQSQAVSNDSTQSKKVDSAQAAISFDQIMKALIAPNAANEVNEEELFAGLVEERVKSLKGDDAAAKFHASLKSQLDTMREPSGYSSYEDATRAALKDMVSSEVLTNEEAESIHGQAFAAAQLDDNTTTLFDGIGGDNDPTKAVDSMEGALLKARMLIEKFDSGEESAEAMALDQLSSRALAGMFSTPAVTLGASSESASEESAVDSESALVAKPTKNTGQTQNSELDKEVDDSAGLAYQIGDSLESVEILLSSSISKMAESVILRDLNGKKVAEGVRDGEDEQGRAKYRFDKKVDELPDSMVVDVRQSNGITRKFMIDDSTKSFG